MVNVWLVWQGSWDGRYLVGVFDAQATAEAFRDEWNGLAQHEDQVIRPEGDIHAIEVWTQPPVITVDPIDGRLEL